MRQIPLAIGLEPPPTFANFAGDTNDAALAHLRGLRMPASPVYLWGLPGSGKTHLLRALAHATQQQGHRVGWFDAATALPWPLIPDWALVVIDRCDELDAERQRAAFALFVEAATHGVQVAAAGRLPPVDLPLREDLRTRLGWGHVFALQPLGEAETRGVLRRQADERGLRVADEVIDYLLTHFPRDLSHLMGLLARLDEFALAAARPLTVPLLKRMLAEAAENTETAG